MKMKSETYDMLKMIAWVFAPLSVFIVSILNIWEIPNADRVTATLAALDTLLGSIVAISNINYNSNQNKEQHDDSHS